MLVKELLVEHTAVTAVRLRLNLRSSPCARVTSAFAVCFTILLEISRSKIFTEGRSQSFHGLNFRGLCVATWRAIRPR